MLRLYLGPIVLFCGFMLIVLVIYGMVQYNQYSEHKYAIARKDAGLPTEPVKDPPITLTENERAARSVYLCMKGCERAVIRASNTTCARICAPTSLRVDGE